MPTYDDTEREQSREDHFPARWRRQYPNGLTLSRIPTDDPHLYEIAVLSNAGMLDIKRYGDEESGYIWDQVAIVQEDDLPKVYELVASGNLTKIHEWLAHEPRRNRGDDE